MRISVNVDFSGAPIGQSSRQLLVYSNDSDESPYTGGVFVDILKPEPGSISVSPEQDMSATDYVHEIETLVGPSN